MVPFLDNIAQNALGPFIGVLFGAGAVYGLLKGYLSRYKDTENKVSKIFGADTGSPWFVPRAECEVKHTAFQVHIFSSLESAAKEARAAAQEAKAAALAASNLAEHTAMHMSKITAEQGRVLGGVTNYLRWTMAKDGMSAPEIDVVLAGGQDGRD